MTKKLTKENHKPSVFGRWLILDNNNNVKKNDNIFHAFTFIRVERWMNNKRSQGKASGWFRNGARGKPTSLMAEKS